MKKSLLQSLMAIPLVLLLCFFPGCQQQQQEEVGLTEEDAKVLADKVLEIWNDGNLALIEEIYSPEIVVHTSSSPVDMVGFEGVTGWVTVTRTAFPDFHMTFDEIIVKDDKLFTRWAATGIHTGIFQMPSGELPPTNMPIKVSGLSIDKIENGKFVDELVVFNVLEMLQQLGFTLAPPQPPEEME
jgi:predicted ester cyclase